MDTSEASRFQSCLVRPGYLGVAFSGPAKPTTRRRRPKFRCSQGTLTPRRWSRMVIRGPSPPPPSSPTVSPLSVPSVRSDLLPGLPGRFCSAPHEQNDPQDPQIRGDPQPCDWGFETQSRLLASTCSAGFSPYLHPGSGAGKTCGTFRRRIVRSGMLSKPREANVRNAARCPTCPTTNRFHGLHRTTIVYVLDVAALQNQVSRQTFSSHGVGRLRKSHTP